MAALWSGSFDSRRTSTWQLEERSEMRSEDEWFCQTCSIGNWWSRTDCRHCASVTNEAADPPQTSTQEKLNILETLAVMGNEDPRLVGRKALEKELEWHQNELKAEEHC